ncbi:hypothetical protein DRE_01815 [Drechslerella stenobrocha 248]|uniref:Uncharacterized protein n=1 Tax=Drechslerella stenobrocha 248 TaxID=1043628 RepID=W7I8H0_9PEZI|nr:hypothetical protein DRE_01815 [Drechslerella stenobrocha 248]
MPSHFDIRIISTVANPRGSPANRIARREPQLQLHHAPTNLRHSPTIHSVPPLAIAAAVGRTCKTATSPPSLLTIMSSLAFYAFYGAACRWMQLSIQRRPHVLQAEAIAYPLYMTVCVGAGMYFDGIEDRHMAFLEQKKQSLLEKRRRREESDRALAGDSS